MKVARYIAIGAAAVGAMALVSVEANAAKCVKVSGEGTGLTPEIAQALATDGVNISIANYGGKGKGKVAMKCDSMPVMTTCKATQKACK